MEAKPISEHSKEIRQLAKEFESWQKILLTLGDETRQHLILPLALSMFFLTLLTFERL